LQDYVTVNNPNLKIRHIGFRLAALALNLQIAGIDSSLKK